MWLFRVASHKEVGAGHMSRCIALAKAIGIGRVKFLLDTGSLNWESVLKKMGLNVLRKDEVYKGNWSGVIYDPYNGKFDELDELLIISNNITLIADHTDVPANTRLFVNYGTDMKNQEVDGVPCLFGPRYALIDREFSLRHKTINDSVKQIIVAFGSYDSGNATGKILEGLANIKWKNTKPDITIVLGKNAPHLDNIRKIIVDYPLNCSLLVDSRDLANIIPCMDLAIGAGGLSLFERLAAGIPSLTLATNKLQLNSIKLAERAGATLDLGNRSNLTSEDIVKKVHYLVDNFDERKNMAYFAKKLVDGKGAIRVAKKLLTNNAANSD